MSTVESNYKKINNANAFTKAFSPDGFIGLSGDGTPGY
jgi:hypothetical protein